MPDVRPRLGWAQLALIASVAAAVVSAVLFVPFYTALDGCEGFGCLGTMAYWPLAGAGSALAGLVVGRRAGRGWRGYGLGLIAATAGYTAANLLIARFGLFPI